MVYECVRAVKIPVIAAGGIRSADDVLEFLVVGATAVQVGTWNFVDPAGIATILNELPKLMTESKIGSIREIIGSLKSLPAIRFEHSEAVVER